MSGLRRRAGRPVGQKVLLGQLQESLQQQTTDSAGISCPQSERHSTEK